MEKLKWDRHTQTYIQTDRSLHLLFSDMSFSISLHLNITGFPFGFVWQNEDSSCKIGVLGVTIGND